MAWTFVGIAFLLFLPAFTTAVVALLYWYICRNHIDVVKRIVVEKPLFIIPRGPQTPDAEEVSLSSTDGLTIRACYWKHLAAERRGVILFGLEFGSNRWACGPAVDFLRTAGYEVFTWEPRNQGDSDRQTGFEPLQWVTEREVDDCRVALKYLKARPDADPRGIGLYGFSKGANAGLLVAASDQTIRCAVTDGAFGHYTVMVPYMRVWFSIYDQRRPLHGLIGPWFFGIVARKAMRAVEKQRGVRFPDVESALRNFAPRALLMIHGGGDSYIKPVMAQALFEYARRPKELWIVPDAKHNQAMTVAGDEYRRKTLEFFDRHLGAIAVVGKARRSD